MSPLRSWSARSSGGMSSKFEARWNSALVAYRLGQLWRAPLWCSPSLVGTARIPSSLRLPWRWQLHERGLHDGRRRRRADQSQKCRRAVHDRRDPLRGFDLGDGGCRVHGPHGANLPELRRRTRHAVRHRPTSHRVLPGSPNHLHSDQRTSGVCSPSHGLADGACIAQSSRQGSHSSPRSTRVSAVAIEVARSS